MTPIKCKVRRLVTKALTAAITVVACAASSSATRVVSLDGLVTEPIEMSQDEAALVDQYVAQEPANEEEKCTYWKRQLERVPAGKKQVVAYVDLKAESVCGFWVPKDASYDPLYKGACGSDGSCPE